jgi:phage tail-like protein
MAMQVPAGEDVRIPFANFAFHVSFEVAAPAGPGATQKATGKAPRRFAPGAGVAPELFGGFSEIAGLEAMMEHKVIKAGGRNYGAYMRAGPVSFGTVVLKRGIVHSQHLWRWWSMFAGADGRPDGRPLTANRCNLLIGLISTIGEVAQPIDLSSYKPGGIERKVRLGWRLRNAMPVKFRVGDLSAKGSDVAVEELHLVHEGLEMDGVAA